MALPATDSFTGANGTQLTTYSANWTLNPGGGGGDFDIQSNALQPDAGGNDYGAHWNADVFNNDQYSQIVWTAETGGAWAGPGCRCDTGGAQTFYAFYCNSGNTSYLFKYVTGSFTQLGSTGGGFAVSDTIYLEADGTSITPKINGTTEDPPGTRTDSSITSGAAGVIGYSDGATQIDDWEGGNLGVIDLSVSVSDGVSLAETTGELLPWLLTSQADAISLSDVVSLLQEFYISTADAIAVAEAVTLLLRYQVSATDAIAIVETALLMLAHQVDVGDSINVAEVVTLLLRHQIDVSDALVVADNLAVLVARPDLYISVDATNSAHLIRGVKIVG